MNTLISAALSRGWITLPPPTAPRKPGRPPLPPAEALVRRRAATRRCMRRLRAARRARSEWVERYQCGCTGQAARKRDLPGYCAIHGANRVELLRL